MSQPTITPEFLAELESKARAVRRLLCAPPATILALTGHIRSLTERLEKAEMDAVRWRFNRAKSLRSPEAADAAIDDAIAQEGQSHE